MTEVNRDITVRLLNGLPSFTVQSDLETEMLVEAGLTDRTSFLRERTSPTTVHVASIGNVPVATAVVTVGPLPELPLGRMLAQAGIEITDDDPLPSPVAELVSLSSDRDRDGEGITEMLYRSYYQQARRAGAESLAVGMDPWVFDLLTDQYGIPFQVLGPLIDSLGRVLLPAGARIDDLEAGVALHAPEFLRFLRFLRSTDAPNPGGGRSTTSVTGGGTSAESEAAPGGGVAPGTAESG